MDGLERARADLDRGDPRKARDRLKGLLSNHPEDLEVRRLLAEAYRRDRQWAEAGRWGYLVDDAATGRERDAFLRHCAFDHRPRVTEERLRRLLRTDDLWAIADEGGRVRLGRLAHLRRPGQSDGPFTALGRFLASVGTWLRRR